ncbi:MAG: ABC transporter ATP-binding protein [Pseudomonadales bacterium]|nr:ABC transporter ATP-binding protein [Pseudomonadales bacterium]
MTDSEMTGSEMTDSEKIRSAISIDQLRVSYRGATVLDNVSLSIVPGEFVSLVGVNGAGKSTLIKSLLDFIDVDGGKLALFGICHQTTQSREVLAFLPERFVVPHYLTGKEYIDYMLSLYGVDRSETSQKDVESMITALDLRVSSLTESVSHYSKGMTQKLGLAACFLSGKKLLILDEPMSGLDPKARVLVKRQLLALKEKGTTVFFSSHLLADVAELADRMIVLNQGQLTFTGTPAECLFLHQTDNIETAFMHCINTGDLVV